MRRAVLVGEIPTRVLQGVNIIDGVKCCVILNALKKSLEYGMKAREIYSDEDTAYITLTQGYVAKIDISDIEIAEGFNWYAIKSRNTIYAVRNDYRNRKQIGLHRLICEASDCDIVDHKDRDGLNNKRSNLRLCTKKQNLWNQGIRSTNKSGYRGVYWCKKREKWRAQISVDSKIMSLGCFIDVSDAASAYAQASKKYYGEYSNANS